MAAGLMVLASCKKEKAQEESNIITIDYEAPKPQAPIAQSSTSSVLSVEWVEGRQYKVKIDRYPADSTAMVENEIGQKYIDNEIKVEVRREDNSVFYNKTFTKASFASVLTGDYNEKAILGGMSVRPKTEESKLVFIAWINYPDAGEDEALTIKVCLDRNGQVSMHPLTDNERDDLLMRDASYAEED